MEIKINDKATTVNATTLQELAAELSLPEKGVAMALGSKMVMREDWVATSLTEGAEVIIIKAVCGG